MMPISYSTHGFPRSSLEFALDAIASAGFSDIELACDLHTQGPPTGKVAAQISKQIEGRRLTVSTSHAPMGRHTPGAPIETWRNQIVDLLSDYIRFVGDLGAKGIVVHTVPYPQLAQKHGQLKSLVEPMQTAARRSLDELAPVAGQAGVRILLENLPYQGDLPFDYPLITMEQLRRFVEPYPQDQVALVVDVGHAWTNGIEPSDEIERAGNRLWGVHLQDVDGENPADNHWVPGQGGLDWQAIREALKAVNYRGTWTFEVTRPRHDESQAELAAMTHVFAQRWATQG